MKPSEIITQRLERRGYVISTPPSRIRAGYLQREAGAASWFVIVDKDGVKQEILSWNTMTEVVRCPDEEWQFSVQPYIFDIHLDIPQKYWDPPKNPNA